MVAEEGHLTRAAERLHASQPAVSAHIKALEEEFGVALFLRSPKGMHLTREGEVLRVQAQKALSTIEEIHQKASTLKEDIFGTVKLGLHIDPRFLRIDRFLSYMQKAYGKIDFHLLQRWSYEQPDALKKGVLDAGYIYGLPDTKDVAAISLRKFNIVVAGPPQWEERLNGAGWEEVANMPWIWTPPSCRFSKIAARAFEKHFIKPLKITVADQEPVIQLLVKSGVGLALMIEEEAMEAKTHGELTVWDTVVDTIDLSFVYPFHRKNDPLLKAVVEGIREVWELGT